MRKRWILNVTLVGGLGLGCAGEVGLSEPPPGGGDHLRSGLTLNVRLASEAAGVAQALGWAAGVPGAEVRVHRIGVEFAWETAITDDQGTADFSHLVSDRYRVAVYRPLTESESEQAGVTVLAAGGIVDVVASGSEQTMELLPNRTESLVISEVYGPSTGGQVGFTYTFHMFFELYNNSDGTVFLDGLTFGWVHTFDIDTPHTSCAESARFRKDPDGVWATYLHRFPGSGGEYPLAPGEAVVVALDAVDHSVVDPRFPDLSNADFELLGSGDVDNPDVPNLVEVGLRSWPHGHGLLFYDGHSLFIANEVDVPSLERAVRTTSAGDSELLRVPAADLLDVMFLERADVFQDQLYVRCDGTVHGNFDQLGGGFLNEVGNLSLSAQRISLPGAAGAAGRLQDTNVSAVDLTKGRITPGSVR